MMKSEVCKKCGASFVATKDKNYCDVCYMDIIYPFKLAYESPEDQIAQRKFKEMKGGKS